MTFVVVPTGSLQRSGCNLFGGVGFLSASLWSWCKSVVIWRSQVSTGSLRNQRPQISKRVIVTRIQRGSENHLTFDGDFDCGPDRVSAWVILFKGMEPLGLRDSWRNDNLNINRQIRKKLSLNPSLYSTLWGDLESGSQLSRFIYVGLKLSCGYWSLHIFFSCQRMIQRNFLI